MIFLPHSLSLGIKNGGINILLEFYIHIIEKNKEKKIIDKPVHNEDKNNKNKFYKFLIFQKMKIKKIKKIKKKYKSDIEKKIINY